MANLTHTAKVFKKIFSPITYIAIVTILIFTIYKGFAGESKPEDKSTSINLEQVSLKGPILQTGSFNTQNLVLPKEYPKTLNVFNKSQTKDFLLNPGSFAQTLGFTEPPIELQDIKTGEKLVYSLEGKYLSVFRNGFSYSDSSIPLTQEGKFSSPVDLISQAKTFLAQLNLSPNFASEYKTKYYQPQGEFEKLTSNPEEATRMVVFLYYEINGIRIIGNNIEITAGFNKQNQMRDLGFNQFTQGDSIGSFDIISPENALQILARTKNTLIDAETPGDFSPLPTAINKVDLSKAYLAYYNSTEGKTLQPIWVFEGKTETGQKDEIMLTYAIPAIAR